ncbi:MAG TPA: DUF4365 domain-containing protein [Nevskia sp.]|nr:DUF4365 domain-containing protein [Nevskia sp.]
MTTDKPSHSRSRATDHVGKLGELRVEGAFSEHLGWFARKDSTDDGVDYNVEVPAEGDRPSSRFLVQVKTRSRMRVCRGGRWAALGVEKEALDKHKRSRLPVFLFGVDLATGEMRACNLSELLRRSPEQKSFSLTPPQRFDGASAQAFKQVVLTEFKEIDDHFHSPGVALEYRAQKLMDANPGLDVRADWISGQQHLGFGTKDGSPLSFRVVAQSEEDNQKLQDVVDFGAQAEVQFKSMRNDRFPLLDPPHLDRAIFKITPAARRLRVRMAVGPVDGPDAALLELDGEWSKGQRGMEIRGAEPSCPFSFTLQTAPDRTTDVFKMHFDFKAWEGKPLAQLPWVTKLMPMAKHLAGVCRVSFWLIVDGEEMEAITFHCDNSADRELRGLLRHLAVVHAVHVVSKALSSTARFSVSDGLSAEQQGVLNVALNILEHGQSTCTAPEITIQPPEELATRLRAQAPQTVSVRYALALSFGGTALGSMPVRIDVPNYQATESAGGTFSFSSSESGTAFRDDAPPDYEATGGGTLSFE